MEIRLPANKLSRMRDMIKAWLPRNKTTKREILSPVGTLQHVTKVFRPGKTFVSRTYLITAKFKKLHFITRLNKAFWFRFVLVTHFLQSWNGFIILHHPTLLTTLDLLPKQMPLEHGDAQQFYVPADSNGSGFWMVRCMDHGKGVGPNLFHLCHLGTHATSLSHQFLVWQWRLGCCYQQTLLKRHNCNAPSTFSMVFHHPLWHYHYSYTPTRSSEHNCWPPLMEN